MRLPALLFIVSIALLSACTKTKKERFQAYYAEVIPSVDGNANDSIWNSIPEWYTKHYIWINNAGCEPIPSDFSWRYKLAWDENKFYVLAEITDDIINDTYTDPKHNYWEDDCFEVMFDEDNSGGNHESSYHAFVYHISIFYDAVDIDNEGNLVLLNDHLDVKMDTLNGVCIWEAAFNIYNKDYISTSKSTPEKLHEGKIMGWAMAYCDNDSSMQRDHFFGSIQINGEDKNLTWKTADVFGEVELIKH